MCRLFFATRNSLSAAKTGQSMSTNLLCRSPSQREPRRHSLRPGHLRPAPRRWSWRRTAWLAHNGWPQTYKENNWRGWSQNDNRVVLRCRLTSRSVLLCHVCVGMRQSFGKGAMCTSVNAAWTSISSTVYTYLHVCLLCYTCIGPPQAILTPLVLCWAFCACSLPSFSLREAVGLLIFCLKV
jgi:hypothetical protein